MSKFPTFATIDDHHFEKIIQNMYNKSEIFSDSHAMLFTNASRHDG